MKERGTNAVRNGRGKGKMRSVLRMLQVEGHFLTFLVDHAIVDTFFAYQLN